jgi:thiol-disulfide isomerase/thioredoxin
MKKIILLINIILLSQVMRGQNSITLFGNIKNPKSKKVFVYYIKDYLTYDHVAADSAELDEKGNFSMTFPWGKPYQASFQHGEESTDLFLTPSDSFKITLDAENFDRSLLYSGRGAVVNSYLAEKTLKNANTGRNIMMACKSLEEKRFTEYVDSVYTGDKAFFKKYFSDISNRTPSITDFMDHEIADISYSWANNKLRYPGFHRYFNNLKEDVALSEKYYDFLKEIDLNNPRSLSSYLYLQTLESYIRYELQKALKKDTVLKDKEKYSLAEENFIQKTFSAEVRDIVLAQKVYTLLVHQNNIELGKKMLDKYAATTKNKECIDILNNAYYTGSKLTPGKAAPEFTYPDMNGKMISLKDFRGKVVYLDIWASWCGPCLKEIPSAKKLEEEFRGKDVVFLCVSIDRNENAWKKVIEEKEITGVHLISKGDFDSDIAKSYNVKGIPRYIIIGKDGNIVNSNAERPGPGVKQEIEKLLK